jgi:hypothetical protein
LGDLNPDILQIIKGARIPPYLAQTGGRVSELLCN